MISLDVQYMSERNLKPFPLTAPCPLYNSDSVIVSSDGFVYEAL